MPPVPSLIIPRLGFQSFRKTGLAVGLMVTASHNPESDNGIKIVDPNGGMLSQDWEVYAEVRCKERIIV